MKDEALLHAIISYAMIHLACFGPKSAASTGSGTAQSIQANADVIAHKLRAIVLINERIGSGQVSDSTIATVLTLVWQLVSVTVSLGNVWVQEF